MNGTPAAAGSPEPSMPELLKPGARLADEIVGHLGFLRRLAGRYRSTGADAEDLAQEAAMRALRFSGRFRPGSNLRAWLARILKNLAINETRRNRSAPEPADLERVGPAAGEGFFPCGGPAPCPERTYLGRIQVERVTETLLELPDLQRLTFRLHFVEGYTFAEISRMLGCPVGTVMSRSHRASEAVRRALQGGA